MPRPIQILLEFVVGVGLMLLVCVWGISKYNAYQQSANELSKNGDEVTAQLLESNYTMYEGTEISGSEAVNFIIRNMGKTFGCIVTTNKGTQTYGAKLTSTDGIYALEGTEGAGTVTGAKNISSNDYINPTADFACKVLRDKNNTIIGMQFTQK